MNNFHTKNVNDIAKEFGSNINTGLNEKNIIPNREKYGVNSLIAKVQKKWWQIFLDQYKDVLMLVLIGASIISLIVSIVPENKGDAIGKALTRIEGWKNFLLIVGVTIINAILGTVQTLKAQKSLNSLRKMTSPKAKVIRGKQTIVIDTKNVVVGDIIVLEAGDFIPADARIISANSLKVNESSLTGESESILKNNALLKKENLVLGDRLNIVYSGCLVTYGRATAIVTAVGNETEIGKINALINSVKDKKTPLQVNLDKLGKVLMYSIIIICLVLLSINLGKIGIFGTENAVSIVANSLNFSVALAVAVIPEALSSIVTIVLSLSAKTLAKKHAIVKELKAVEGLGSVSIICSDKTGTLTQNKMTIKNIFVDLKNVAENDFNVKNSNQKKLIDYAVLCSDAKSKDGVVVGDPTEIALIDYHRKNKFDPDQLNLQFPRLSELPFDSQRMMMSTLIKDKNSKVMIVKGAVDKLLDKMSYVVEKNKVRAITKKDVETILAMNKSYAKNGERVLCFAYKNLKKTSLEFSDENNLTFLGLMSMIDPPRPEVIESIKECKLGSITPIMITGDHVDTAVAIATQIGIFDPNKHLALSGEQLAEMDDKVLAANVHKYSVYARVSPEDKIKIVRAWQTHNKIVSMTGDGVNDAPALKEANIGVAMGITGTEVSKDAASIILTDDNFTTIVDAVKIGRNIYNNIKNAIRFLLTGNLATIFIAAIITIFTMAMEIEPLPFVAIQLLFLNLLTDSWPAIALGLEGYKKEVIYEKPRNANEFFLTKPFVKKIVNDAIIMAMITLAVFFISFYSSQIGNVANQVDANNIRFTIASGTAFMTLTFCRLFHGFNCKSNNFILFNSEIYNNYYLIGAFFIGLVLVLLIYFIPGLNGIFFVELDGIDKNLVNNDLIIKQTHWFGVGFAGGAAMLLVVQAYLGTKKLIITNKSKHTKEVISIE